MGTRLVLKDANFASNGINEGDVAPSILLSFPLTLGKAWYSSSKVSPYLVSDNENRVSSAEYVGINGASYGTIKLKAKAGYKFAVYFGTESRPGIADSNLVDWGYTTEGNTLTLDISTALYAMVMIGRIVDAPMTSTDINDYIEDVSD